MPRPGRGAEVVVRGRPADAAGVADRANVAIVEPERLCSPHLIRSRVDVNDFFRGDELFGGDEFFRRFFGGPPGFDRDGSGEGGEDRGERSTPLAATGTGFVVDGDGLILTNNHVVENATGIEVQFFGDDERYEARVLAARPRSSWCSGATRACSSR